MKRMICFGDSNTFGYDAGSRLGRQLEEKERWPEVFADVTGWDIVNEGMNGREIPEGWFLERFDRILEEDAPADILAVMLGTNDILNSFRPDAREVGKKMEAFLRHALSHPQIGGDGSRILLIAPAVIDIGRYDEDEAVFDREVKALGPVYRRIAQRLGVQFADTSDWDIPLAHDGVHWTGEGHQMFARKLSEELGFGRQSNKDACDILPEKEKEIKKQGRRDANGTGILLRTDEP